MYKSSMPKIIKYNRCAPLLNTLSTDPVNRGDVKRHIMNVYVIRSSLLVALLLIIVVAMEVVAVV